MNAAMTMDMHVEEVAALAPADLFIADPHGEYEEFSHIVRSGCHTVSRVIAAHFGDTLSPAEAAELATTICYPAEKLAVLPEDAANAAFLRMAQLTTALGATTPMPRAPETPFSVRAKAIREACVDNLHVLGDIFDRGPAPDAILDELAAFPRTSLIWGNHDILWMGAALGQPALVCTAIRICARYGNLSILEDNYSMDLSALRAFAHATYDDDPAQVFFVKHNPALTDAERRTTTLIQKAMAIIQFKVEAACSVANPDFDLERRNLLGRINWAAGTVDVDGTTHPMLDLNFPTVDPANPYALTAEESTVLDACVAAFTGCKKLQRHVKFMLDKGALYRILPATKTTPDLLLFHACVPLDARGACLPVTLFGTTLAGRALFDAVDAFVRDAANATGAAKTRGQDMLWYLWQGAGSPLFAKSKMATFELYFIADKTAQKEAKNPFYKLLEDDTVMRNILAEFGLDEGARIICGHVPVKVKDGEDPVKCGGRLIILDGGMSKPYQKNTGVAGFTLVRRADSPHMELYTHETFCGRAQAIAANEPLRSTMRTL